MKPMSWIAFALLSFLLTGVGNFMAKMATTAGQSGISVTLIIFAMDVLIALGLIVFKKPVITTTPAALGYSVAAGFLTGLGLLCLILALGKPQSQAGIATALMNANFIIVALLSWVMLKDMLTLKQMIGMFAILGGMLLFL